MAVANNTNPSIQFTTSGLSPEYCFTSFQRLNLDIVGALLGFLPGTFSGFIVQEATPDVADRNKLWYKLNVGGSPTGKFFFFFGGFWISPNPEVALSPVRRFLECTEAEVWSYDGGDGVDPSLTAPTSNTGAMWTVDTNYSARMAIGAGTLSPSTTVLAVGDNAGVDQITALEVNIPQHRHVILTTGTGKTGDSLRNPANPNPSGFPADTSQTTNYWGGAGDGTGSNTTTPMNILNPVRAGLWCKRTVRANYVG